jgi:hypothetical protein
VTEEWRKLHNEELRDLYSSPSILRIIIILVWCILLRLLSIRKTKTPLFATVFVVLSILLHVSAYIGHLQVLRIQNDGSVSIACSSSFDILYTQYLKMAYVGRNM